jgi:hypothetical protein
LHERELLLSAVKHSGPVGLIYARRIEAEAVLTG